MTRSSHSARNFCGSWPNAFAAMASNSSSDGSVEKCPPGGEKENELAAMALSLTDDPGYIGASPFGGKLIGRSQSPENMSPDNDWCASSSVRWLSGWSASEQAESGITRVTCLNCR